MDILNFISWIKGGRVVTTVDPTQTLLPVGLKDSRRDDGYLAGAISVEDFANQVGGLQTVAVDGVTITGDGTPGDPLVAAGGSSYKVYTALLTQSGTNAPVATVLENTLGGVPVWARSGQGSFNITLSGAFPIGKTITFLTIRGDDADGRIIAEINYTGAPNANVRGFVFKNASTNLNADGIGTLSSIEIRVYP